MYKTKFKEDGSIDQYKARLVAKGFTQIKGQNFEETYSHVIKHITVGLIISIAVTCEWKIRQLDIKKAFLRGHLKEIVYVEQPPAFISPTYPHHVCLLKHSLYGLKHVPRA